ncbi:class I SAM-dependent methyltransferase [Roseibacterium sp. SDUM158016]|uniref:class I SAM-dependent methyltransferase n=1 Tax=Roseicyclus sediminis TaxID=2980997 RepID=UPI0021CE1029|nr:class I SAM-dependent methyltransferase [Roseibacterium sp. SDUM158016]MCU4652078.1 class I SAM-dependent methyltransferase [Roseibacterium sp. SDUM158016]
MSAHHDVFAMDEIPTMISSQDGDMALRLTQDLGPDATIVELGPWLGGLSQILAPKGNLHVIDTFVWTRDHDKRVPDLVAPGDSFRPVFEALMRSRDLPCEVHEADFTAFRWPGGRIDLAAIDAPKKPEQLKDALLAIAPGLGAGSRLLIKNGNNSRYFPMMAYLQALADQGALALLEADPEGTCNSAAFEVRLSSDELTDVIGQTPLEYTARSRLLDGALGRLGTFQLGLVCELVGLNAWTEAYVVIGEMDSSRRILRDWDKRELDLARSGADPEQLGWLAEIMSLQHSKGGLPAPPTSFKASAAMTRRAFWINNRNKPWRGRAFHPEVLDRAYQYGYVSWANAIQDHVRDKSILDVGCGPGLHGFGYLAAGASDYLGLDPIIDVDRDRVKNLAAKSAKMPFGWTPAELSAMVEPWLVRPTAIEDLPEERVFDLAVMHNVTEHLQNIESVFAAIAIRLKPGGKLLYNHHNFYCWNGHHLPPKVVSAIDKSDPSQAELMDWGHVGYDPSPDHYIARGLNRIRLDDLIALTERYFDIEVSEEKPSRPETGLGRLTDKIRRRYPHLADRDFETQNLLCIATVKT